jgi:hypothetical protein
LLRRLRLGGRWRLRGALGRQFQHAGSGDAGGFRAELDLLKEVLGDEIMNLALANAELASGFAIAEENRKGFVAASEQDWNGFVAAVHDALLRASFHASGCIAAQSRKII